MSMPDPDDDIARRLSHMMDRPQPDERPDDSAAAEPTTVEPDAGSIVPQWQPALDAPAMAQRVVERHVAQSLEFKRTIIPIMLTLGVLCPMFAILGWFAEEDAPLARLGQPWFAMPVLLVGILMLILAGLTMAQVKHELASPR